MARLMHKWLVEYIAEELKLALEWKRQSNTEQHIKVEQDEAKGIKQEPSDVPELAVLTAAERAYEDDGSNLRARLHRTVEVQSVLQIIGVRVHWLHD